MRHASLSLVMVYCWACALTSNAGATASQDTIKRCGRRATNTAAKCSSDTNTMPVLSTSPPGTGQNVRIDARNASALEYVIGQHIPLDDLHALMLQHQRMHQGGIHYLHSGYDTLARQAADSITKLLPGAIGIRAVILF